MVRDPEQYLSSIQDNPDDVQIHLLSKDLAYRMIQVPKEARELWYIAAASSLTLSMEGKMPEHINGIRMVSES